jgi:hypothetical protein
LRARSGRERPAVRIRGRPPFQHCTRHIATPAQHPLSEPPTISVRFTEPPSVVGTGGGQTVVDEWLDTAAVVVADCVDVPGVSPGNNNGAWGLVDADALIPAVLPPAVVVDPLPEPAEADPPEDPVGKGDVGTLSGSAPTLPAPVPPLPLAVAPPSALVWPLVSSAVWASAVVMPRNMIAIRRMFRIVFLLLLEMPPPKRALRG